MFAGCAPFIRLPPQDAFNPFFVNQKWGTAIIYSLQKRRRRRLRDGFPIDSDVPMRFREAKVFLEFRNLGQAHCSAPGAERCTSQNLKDLTAGFVVKSVKKGNIEDLLSCKIR